MKIAFIINSLSGGGAERVIQTLSNSLIKKGYEIHIILLNNEKQVYELHANIKVYTLKTSIISKGLGKIIFIPLQSIELFFLLKKLKVKNAISFLVRANLVFSFVKYFSNFKVVISERSFASKHYERKSFSNQIMNFLIKKLYFKADLIVPISNGIKESLVKDYHLNENKISVIHNPQNIDYINDYKLFKIDFIFEQNYRYFITLGRLIELKDHVNMIKAFRVVKDSNPMVKLLILGEGPLKNNLQSLINNLGLEYDVLLLGFIKNPFEYLKRSDVFVFSSKFEGFGNVIVEAMACGLPVISTNCPSGPSEILDNGKYGMLVDVENYKDLAAKMVSMLYEETLTYFKNQSTKRAKDFNVKTIEQEYLKVFEGDM
ncbi:MAG: glycosyltransferase [Arcobacter sp.]|jgi:N-acetylgalactosamine-N,N'-diacetylbacillosaminyl-diphospho-undecaprenol 4-alpha-N-acetylgalactosaminyltransferase|uniref:glycosyltransferase n=1 Tax=Arcobacter sp. TaxID=1872629 RepID=UPI002A750D6C|nr:glycosyltransferase [Arcobacter sp.]MDY3199999.1 glycosyltransferase [Arcobacter sp.]